MLECGADVHDIDDEGRTPLHTAILYHRIDYVQHLLKYKADPLVRKTAYQFSSISVSRKTKIEILTMGGYHLSR